MPVGSVVAWPKSSNPTSGGVWLECNGQTIPAQYKKLREIMGDKTPNYAGLFLRGYGSQTASFDQGWLKGGVKPTVIKSGELGVVQGYASKYWMMHSGPISLDQDLYDSTKGNTLIPNHGWKGNWHLAAMVNAWGTQLGRKDTDEIGTYTYDNPSDWAGKIWILKKPPKKYSVDGNGNVREYDDTDSGFWDYAFNSTWAASNQINGPTDKEVRPSNIAVRYFIKAR